MYVNVTKFYVVWTLMLKTKIIVTICRVIQLLVKTH
jgi:hypothetical protein